MGGKYTRDINEEMIQSMILTVINEEAMKVSRADYNKVQFRLDELMSTLSEMEKELRKLSDQMPTALMVVTKKKINSINDCLVKSKDEIGYIRNKVIEHKRRAFTKSDQ